MCCLLMLKFQKMGKRPHPTGQNKENEGWQGQCIQEECGKNPAWKNLARPIVAQFFPSLLRIVASFFPYFFLGIMFKL